MYIAIICAAAIAAFFVYLATISKPLEGLQQTHEDEDHIDWDI